MVLLLVLARPRLGCCGAGAAACAAVPGLQRLRSLRRAARSDACCSTYVFKQCVLLLRALPRAANCQHRLQLLLASVLRNASSRCRKKLASSSLWRLVTVALVGQSSGPLLCPENSCGLAAEAERSAYSLRSHSSFQPKFTPSARYATRTQRYTQHIHRRYAIRHTTRNTH